MVSKISTKSRASRSPSPNDPIGVFDSGVGGLSVLRELQRRMPHERFVFAADQRHVPYGEKSREQLIRYTTSITRFLVSKKCKLIVVACNTGTVYAIDALRKRFSVPFVGTVPAIKPAVALSKSKDIGILSTPATAISPALKGLVRTYAAAARVYRIGCAGLEELVERGITSGPEADAKLRTYLAPLRRAGVDVIVLGCTHYPFLRRRITSLSGARVIDSGPAIARRTQTLLTAARLNRMAGIGTVTYYTNGSPAAFSRVAGRLLRRRVRAAGAGF